MHNNNFGTLFAFILSQGGLKKPKQALDRLKGYKMSSFFKTAFVSRGRDEVGQLLALLEVLESQKCGKMVRISGQLSEILANEKNLRKVQQARNLDELLDIVEGFKLKKMMRVPCAEVLKASYPNLAKGAFF